MKILCKCDFCVWWDTFIGITFSDALGILSLIVGIVSIIFTCKVSNKAGKIQEEIKGSTNCKLYSDLYNVLKTLDAKTRYFLFTVEQSIVGTFDTNTISELEDIKKDYKEIERNFKSCRLQLELLFPNNKYYEGKINDLFFEISYIIRLLKSEIETNNRPDNIKNHIRNEIDVKLYNMYIPLENNISSIDRINNIKQMIELFHDNNSIINHLYRFENLRESIFENGIILNQIKEKVIGKTGKYGR